MGGVFLKKVGIIGGMGPESTLEYYRSIVYRYQKCNKIGAFPSVVIDSVNIYEMLELCKRKDYSGLKEFILRAIENISKAGADFGVIASNTPHIVFEEVEKSSPIPLISIVEETFKKVKEMNYDKVGLIGTKFTMSEDFYKKVFRLNNIVVSVPEDCEQDYINDKIFQELEYGIVKEETKKDFLNILYGMRKRHNIKGVILGCTELPLLVKDEDIDMKLFNTTDIHINCIVDYMS
jgi:aspartate racemase